MCILCVIQKWSRKVATMLPWLVIPLIGLWLLSQFLPPAFRFEITSPRLACVLVLLVTLFWYEILMPQLSSWRARRNARLRERKRFEAIEMQKLRKTATRRCRNCLTPYRDQNPSGGRFMCSYCGHISKRPVLDLSVPPGLGRLSSSGILKDLVGKGGKMLNGKVWSDNNWICGQDWLENGGYWINGSLSRKSSYLKKNSGGFFRGGNDHFFSEKSYSFLLVFVCKSLAAIFLGIMWLWRKLFRVSLGEDDTSSDADIRGVAKKDENGVNSNESRSEKARRKAEEKKQARLEREQLEEEERKQREEVARLVEERRKLRDEKAVTQKDQGKGSPRDNNEKREAERKRQERKKEKDRGSSKSNSDVDEVDKRAGKEIERNRKDETDRREHHRSGTYSLRFNNTDTGHSSKVVTAKNHSKKSVGAQYLDRMRGNFFPSSRTHTDGGFFGKGTNANASNIREHKSGASFDHAQVTASKRVFDQPERAYGKSNAYADDQNHNRPALFEPQPYPAPKRSWQQLFTRSSTTTSSTSTNVISRPSGKSQTEARSSIATNCSVTEGVDNPITIGLPCPGPKFSYANSTSIADHQLSNLVFPRVGEVPTELRLEESDNFEDPCYVPDPVSLIGPVSESLNNFQLDLGFLPDVGFETPCPIKHIPPSSEVNRPSPIESPMSRSRVSDEMHANSFLFPSTQRIQDKTVDDHGTANEKGWQMWNSSPLCQDTLGLVGGSPTWYLPSELSGLNNDGVVQSQPSNTMPSMLKKEENVPSNTKSQPQLWQNAGTSNFFMHDTSDDPWALSTLYGVSRHKLFPLNPQEGTTHKELTYGGPDGSATNHQFPLSHGSVWAKKEKAVEGIGSTSSIGDVQSLWSYER